MFRCIFGLLLSFLLVLQAVAYDIVTKPVRIFQGHSSTVTSVGFSRDGNSILSGSLDATMKLWNKDSGEIINSFEGYEQTQVWSAYLSPNNLVAFSVSKDDIVRVWDTNSGNMVVSLKLAQISTLAFSQDGKYALSGHEDSTIKFWDSNTGDIISSSPINLVKATTFSHDNKYAASGHSNGDIILWEIDDNNSIKKLKSFKGHLGDVLSIVFTPDNKRILSGGKDSKLKLWHINTGTEIHSFEEHSNSVTSVAVSPDGYYVLSGSRDKTIKLWNIETGALLYSFEENREWVNSVAFSPDGRYVLSGSGRNISLWQIKPTDDVTPPIQEEPVTIVDTSEESPPVDEIIEEKPPIEESTQQSPSEIGKAIIITASGAHQENTLFPRSEELTKNMYLALRQRGYTDKDIIWLNPKKWQDINGDGRPDDNVVDDDLFDPEKALEKAFAATTHLKVNQQFVLHIHGHAEPNKLKITRDYWLEASQLKTLLDKIPSGVQQIIVLDTCYSGSFLDELSGVDSRIVLTASNADSVAWNAKYETFSGKLIEQLRRGDSFVKAFRAAEDMMIAMPDIFDTQRPQLDDDGDGIYSTRDGVRSAQVILGKEGSRAADAPEIVEVHEPLVLPPEIAEAVLWIKTSPSGSDNVRKVRAILIPPGLQEVNYQGEETDFGRIEVELLYNPAQDRFELMYPSFSQGGMWRIMYEVQGLDGTWSNKVIGEVNAAGVTKPVIVNAKVNQSTYKVDEHLRFDLILKSNNTESYDIYAAIIFPNGSFVTLGYPDRTGLPNTIIPYQVGISVDISKTINILDLVLPMGLTLGMYQACGVMLPTGHDPWDSAAWIMDCKTFELR